MLPVVFKTILEIPVLYFCILNTVVLHVYCMDLTCALAIDGDELVIDRCIFVVVLGWVMRNTMYDSHWGKGLLTFAGLEWVWHCGPHPCSYGSWVFC